MALMRFDVFLPALFRFLLNPLNSGEEGMFIAVHHFAPNKEITPANVAKMPDKIAQKNVLSITLSPQARAA